METAKVDIRKLQVLNDRINQCIDALGQVRLSVHGLSHSGPQSFPGQAFGSPYPQAGFGQLGSLPMGGYGQGWGLAQGQSPFAGLSHSSPGSYPSFQPGFPQMSPYFQGWGQGQSPFGGGLMHSSPNPYQPFPQGQQLQLGYPQTGGYAAGWGSWPQSQPGLGLSHSTPETGGDVYSRLPLHDPFVATRITQTFPYLQYPQPPGLF